MDKKILTFVMALFGLFACEKELAPNLPDEGIKLETEQQKTFTGVMSESELRDFALTVPAKYSNTSTTKSSSVTKTIKEIIPFTSTKWVESKLVTRSASERDTLLDDIYIVNYDINAGFSILSANSQIEPVLAYAEKGNLSDDKELPWGLKRFLEYLPSYITSDDVPEYLATVTNADYDELPLPPTDSVDNEGHRWENPRYYYKTVSQMQIGPYNAAEWGQRYPYNYFCPVENGITCPVGCVAVALGQIMAWHKYPTQFTYNSTSYQIDWGTNNRYYSFTSLTEDSEVIAALLREIGNKVHMIYTPTGSGSNIQFAYSALKEFGYTSDNICDYNSSKMLTSLENQRPVYMRGDEEAMGHAWVVAGNFNEIQQSCCDWDVYNDITGEYLGVWTTQGLEDDIVISQWYNNWGWDGDYNGYYSTFVVNGYNFSNLQIIPEIRVL